MAQNKKISKYKRYRSFDIGMILFGFILFYLLISLFMYLTSGHVVHYEVTAGSIAGNYRYTALALKEEQVITSVNSGRITFYSREGAKTGSGYAVCSVDNAVSAAVNEVSEEAELTSDDYLKMRDTIQTFTIGFDDSIFQNVYNLKADLETFLVEEKQNIDADSSTSLNQVYAPASGFVVYSIDGMENLQENQLTEDLFNTNNYRKTNLRMNTSVKSGDAIFKLVTGESWSLYFPITHNQATELQNRSTIRFRFLKDNNTFTAGFSIIENQGCYYGKISLNNSLVRYVSDRYLEIELLMDRKYGLKIPTSSIAEKTFYKIPEEYVIENNDTKKEITMLRESFNSDGSSVVRYVTANVYSKPGAYYLVNTELFNEGDYVRMVDTNKKHQIIADDKETIKGVYNINKGYAVFREVEVLDENEEFCIVKDDNIYGLATHDRIVLDASNVQSDEIINK